MWYDLSSKNLVIATPKHSTGPSAPRHQCRWPLRDTSGDFWDFSQNYNWWYWWYHDDIMIIFPKLSECILLVTLNLGVLTNDLHQWKRHPRTGQASTGQHRNPRISDLKWLKVTYAIPQEFSQHTFLFKKWCQVRPQHHCSCLNLSWRGSLKFVEVLWTQLKTEGIASVCTSGQNFWDATLLHGTWYYMMHFNKEQKQPVHHTCSSLITLITCIFHRARASSTRLFVDAICCSLTAVWDFIPQC